jgi:predicted DCC family thiol-disulfide oxidoreductase YuxK
MEIAGVSKRTRLRLAKRLEEGYNCGVTSALRVVSPPAKPLMVYDGDCNFCTLCIRRWQHATGGRVDYLPFQDLQIAARFPEIPRERFESAVQLIQPDGSVVGAAEAVFRALAVDRHGRWLLDWYQHSPFFSRTAESTYHFVACHRTLFSVLTRWLWGRHVERPTQVLVRWTFLRCLGVIYLIAFASLRGQIMGLIGSDGILPANLTMAAATRQVTVEHIGWDRYHLLPTLCWLDSSDGFLRFQCAAGIALSILLIFGIAPAPCLFLLWLIYLSLTSVSGVFLGFQWDNLLLETGLLALFFAPLQLLPRGPSREGPPSRVALWLLRWLLFRLIFESGCVKWLSGEPAWRHLTALTFHYETQPLPTWIGWYAHQLPVWIQKSEAALMFAIELAVPFLIFGPRRPRQFACLAFVALQGCILLTGNYGFFNLLTLALCLTLLDDAALQRWLPKWRTEPPPTESSAAQGSEAKPARDSRALRWPAYATLPVAALVACTSYVQLFGMFGVRLPGPEPVLAVYRLLLPLRSFNNYGLFSVMTTSRLEIILEGSNDGVKWEAYEFKYKPGELRNRPRFVAPHQPRLDWQMWFAALGDYRHSPWLVNFCLRLLQGSPEPTALLAHNPFPGTPPRYVRALVYEYHFTDPDTRRSTGDWWRRDYKGIYLPSISLRQTD